MSLHVEECGDMVKFHFFLPQERIGYARFILEGYDHLGTQTSNAGSSHVIWTVPIGMRTEAEHLLEYIVKI